MKSFKFLVFIFIITFSLSILTTLGLEEEETDNISVLTTDGPVDQQEVEAERDDGTSTSATNELDGEKEDKNQIYPTPKPFLKEPEGPPIAALGNNFGAAPLPIKLPEGVHISTFNGSSFEYYAGRANCLCGTPSSRIVGGEKAKIKDYPWTVVLFRRNWFSGRRSQFCGGTLINNQYVVTASHCVDGMIPPALEVGLLEENLAADDENEEKTQYYRVDRITMHPGYDRRSIDNDIAVIRLSSPAPLGAVIIPACLPANNDHDFENVIGTAAGWGATAEGGSTSKVLNKVDVPIMNNTFCNTETKYKDKITENMMCAGFLEGGKDSCQGDSGGPFTIENGGRRTLVGIVSWGYGCARPNSPGVYTRVGRYPQWILSNSQGAEWCSL